MSLVSRALGSPVLRPAAQWGYEAAARAAARALSRIAGVEGVAVTGSLSRNGRVAPGHSDIDLVLLCDLPTVDAEVNLLRSVLRFHRRVGPLRKLFYNVDALQTAELPFARAFGGTWEVRLDRAGRVLEGTGAWDRRVRRPDLEIRLECLSMALRRWLNTGSRLLDPRIRVDDAAVFSARRLANDIAELWVVPASDLYLADVDAPIGQAASRAAHSSALSRFAAGATGTPEEQLRCALTAAFEMVDAWSKEVSDELNGQFHVVGEVEAFEPPAALDRLSSQLLGESPATGSTVLRRGPRATEHYPLVITDVVPDALGRIRWVLERARGDLAELDPWARRLGVLSPAMWRAAALLEPAPFAGATAVRPLWTRGDVPTPPAPSAAVVESQLRARSVEAFTLLRAIRSERSREHQRRFRVAILALLDAIVLAEREGTFDVSWSAARPSAPGERDWYRRVQAWSADRRQVLGPLLDRRLAGR